MGTKQTYRLLGSFVYFPQGKGIALRIQADGEVAHAWYGGFLFADGSTELLDFRRCLADRWHADVIGDRLLRMHPWHHAAIGRGLWTTGIDMPVVVDGSRQLANFRPNID